MENEEDIPAEVKRVILQEQIDIHKNTRYQLQVLAKVNRSIGSPPEQLKQYIDELARLEKIIDALKAELAAL